MHCLFDREWIAAYYSKRRCRVDGEINDVAFALMVAATLHREADREIERQRQKLENEDDRERREGKI
jgi:hypothetical protein